MESGLRKITQGAPSDASPVTFFHTAAQPDDDGKVWTRYKPVAGLQFWQAVSAIILIGLALRLPTITKSLWLDEAYTAWFTALPFRKLWTDVPVYEVHPPLYNIVLKAWTAVSGRTEAGLRSLSVAASLATILLLALSGKALRAGPLGDRVSLLAALLLAVNAGNINFAQQARPYAFETLTASMAILSALVLLRRLQSNAEVGLKALLPAMLGLAVGAGSTLWLHNTGIFIPYGIWIGLTIALLGFVPGNRRLQALAVALPGICALLVWSPFLSLFLHQSSHLAEMAFWVTLEWGDLFSAWYLAAGGSYPMFIILAFAILGLGNLWRKEPPFAAMQTILLILPLATVLVIGYFYKPFYIDRLFEWLSPIVLGLAAVGILTGLSSAVIRQIAVAAAVLFSLASTYVYYTTPTEDWRGLIGNILAEAKPGDIIVTNPNDISVPFDYYAPDLGKRLAVLFTPSPYPSVEIINGVSTAIGTPMIVPGDQVLVRNSIAGHPRVWLIERRADFYDPDSLISREISSVRKLQQTSVYQDIYVSLFE